MPWRERRREWIYNSLRRDLKMIDTQIMAGLQNGTAFFASTSIFAIGSCFALLGATEKVDAVFADLPFVFHSGHAVFEMKVGGLAALVRLRFLQVRLVLSALQLLHHSLRLAFRWCVTPRAISLPPSAPPSVSSA